MIWAVENAPFLVVVDPPRRRYRLLVPVPTAADVTRAAYLGAVEKYVRWRLVKDGRADVDFDPAALVADVNGWFTLP